MDARLFNGPYPCFEYPILWISLNDWPCHVPYLWHIIRWQGKRTVRQLLASINLTKVGRYSSYNVLND